ncbi:MAG: uracil-DNA glycosylase family protein [Christensenellales bacterium]
MQTSWEELHQQIAACRACALCQDIQHKVPGQGDPHARLLLVGEGPGVQEDRQGLAFVGPAGELLSRMLGAIGLARESVFIANVVKCRPPGNRVPSPQEAACCLPFLRAQFALIRPRVVLLLGSTALKTLISPDLAITKCRGGWILRKGVWFMPSYHPAALLRDPEKKHEAWADLQLVRDKLKALAASP